MMNCHLCKKPFTDDNNKFWLCESCNIRDIIGSQDRMIEDIEYYMTYYGMQKPTIDWFRDHIRDMYLTFSIMRLRMNLINNIQFFLTEHGENLKTDLGVKTLQELNELCLHLNVESM